MISKRKNLLTQQKTAGCHTLERDSCYSISMNNADELQAAVNNKIEAEYFPELVDIEPCAMNILFPLYKNKAPPVVKKSCPKYTCDSDIHSCAVLHTDENNTKIIQLNPCSNHTSFECDFNEGMIPINDKLNISCTEKPNTPKKR